MTRFAVFLLALSLAACDAGAPTSDVSAGASGAVPLASISSKHAEVHPISESIAVEASDERVILHIDGQKIEMSAVDAYSVGAALSRIGYEMFEQEEVAVVMPPKKGGSKCYPAPEGSTAFAVGGMLLGKCPPPPPPDFNVRPDFWKPFVPEGVEAMRVPGGVEWREIPGGYIGDIPR